MILVISGLVVIGLKCKAHVVLITWLVLYWYFQLVILRNGENHVALYLIVLMFVGIVGWILLRSILFLAMFYPPFFSCLQQRVWMHRIQVDWKFLKYLLMKKKKKKIKKKLQKKKIKKKKNKKIKK